MAEIRRGFGGDAGTGGERLPWLEPVEEEEEYAEGGGYGGLAVAGIGVLIALAILVTLFMLFRHWHAQHSDIGQVIHAPATPYKEKPANPGGLQMRDTAPVAERTGTGNDLDAPIDLAATPEAPVAGPGSGHPTLRQQQPVPTMAAPQTRPATTAPVPPRPSAPPAASVPEAPPPAAIAPKPTPAPTPTAPAELETRTVAEGGTIQLGAFSTEGKAKAAWKTLSGRFAFLQPMAMAIVPVKSGDATLYRLRASGGGKGSALCAKLKVAGETCAVVG